MTTSTVPILTVNRLLLLGMAQICVGEFVRNHVDDSLHAPPPISVRGASRVRWSGEMLTWSFIVLRASFANCDARPVGMPHTLHRHSDAGLMCVKPDERGDSKRSKIVWQERPQFNVRWRTEMSGAVT